MMRVFITLLCVSFAVCAMAGQEGDSRRATRLYDEVRCPTCVSQSVREAATIAAGQIRTFIDGRIAAGASDEHILEELRFYYGERISFNPQLGWQSIALWMVPGLFLFFALRKLYLTYYV